jgi:hypothetical protein
LETFLGLAAKRGYDKVVSQSMVQAHSPNRLDALLSRNLVL